MSQSLGIPAELAETDEEQNSENRIARLETVVGALSQSIAPLLAAIQTPPASSGSGTAAQSGERVGSALYVTLKASKTDPYRKGVTLVIGVG